MPCALNLSVPVESSQPQKSRNNLEAVKTNPDQSKKPHPFKALFKVVTNSILPCEVRLLFVILVLMAWKRGRCWPSLKTLGGYLGRCEDSITSYHRILQAHGLVVIRRTRKGLLYYPVLLGKVPQDLQNPVSTPIRTGSGSPGEPIRTGSEQTSKRIPEHSNEPNVGEASPVQFSEQAPGETTPTMEQDQRRNVFSPRLEEEPEPSPRLDSPDTYDRDIEDPAMVRALILESLKVADRLADPPSVGLNTGMVPIGEIVRAVSPQQPVADPEGVKPQGPPSPGIHEETDSALESELSVSLPTAGVVGNTQVKTAIETKMEPKAVRATQEQSPRKFKALGSKVDMDLIHEIETLTGDRRSRGCYIKVLRYARPETVQVAMAAVRAVRHEQSGVNLGAYFVRVIQNHEPGIVGTTAQVESQAPRPTPVPKPPKVQAPPQEPAKPWDTDATQYLELWALWKDKKISNAQLREAMKAKGVTLDG